MNNSQWTIHNSQWTIHNSQFKIHNSKFTIHNGANSRLNAAGLENDFLSLIDSTHLLLRCGTDVFA